MTLIQRIITSGPDGTPMVKVTEQSCMVCRGTGIMTVVASREIEEKISCPHCMGTGKILD